MEREEQGEPRRPDEDQPGDVAAIESGIWDAEQFQQPIDDATAQRIARQLHRGEYAALYRLAIDGALADGLLDELSAVAEDLPDTARSWPDHLRGYIEQRGEDCEPRDGWTSLTDGGLQDVHAIRLAAHLERRANRALFERYVELGIHPEDAEAVIEYSELLRQQQGGADQQPPDDQQETAAPLPPRIFVTDASADRPPKDALRGIWLDAAVDEEELEQAVHELLRTSPATGARSYRISAAVGFEGFEISTSDSLATVARVARGIAEHGRAFAAFVDAWGSTQEAVDEFSRYYLGSYPSLAHWAEAEVEGRGWWDELNEHAPPGLLPYLRIDYERLGRELTYDAHVVEDEEGQQVHVFRLA